MDGGARHVHACSRAGCGPRSCRANPKNLILNATAAADIAQAGLSAADQVLVLIVFVRAASLGIITPVVVYFGMGDGATRVLEEWKTWLAANSTAVKVVRRCQ